MRAPSMAFATTVALVSFGATGHHNPTPTPNPPSSCTYPKYAYYSHPSNVSQSAADTLCRTKGGWLASIRSSSDFAKLKTDVGATPPWYSSTGSSTTYVVTGGSANSTYTYAGSGYWYWKYDFVGTPATNYQLPEYFTTPSDGSSCASNMWCNWGPGEPNADGVVLYLYSGGNSSTHYLLADGEDSRTANYLCEFDCTVAPGTTTPAPTPATAIGADMDGSRYYKYPGEEYMLCGKCTHKSVYPSMYSYIDTSVKWYKLVCDTSATSSSKWGTLHYNCDEGCGNCSQTSSITIGKELVALYRGDTTYSHLMVPVSIQCCPQVIQQDNFVSSDTTCAGTPTHSMFTPAGCWSSKAESKDYEEELCTTDGAAPSIIRYGCNADKAMQNGDQCPASPSAPCLLDTTGITNDPCIKFPVGTTYNGKPLEFTSYSSATVTLTCRINATQQCLRLVESSHFVAAEMTARTDDISALSCVASTSGVSLATSAVAIVVVAMVAALV